MKILIIIPAYNEQDNIQKVVDELTEHYPEYDYLVVNDCSVDRTEEILVERNYRHITLCNNLGIGGAVQSGYMYATQHHYDIAIQLDGDGQHNPADIPALIAPIVNQQADIVIGSRFIEKRGFQTTALRRMGNHFLGRIIRLCCGVEATDTTSGFRASNRKANEFFVQNYAHDYPEPEAIVSASLNGFRICDVPVSMRERNEGTSSINAIRSVYYMIKVSLSLMVCCISMRRRKKSTTPTYTHFVR